jgi:hypothetical protein
MKKIYLLFTIFILSAGKTQAQAPTVSAIYGPVAICTDDPAQTYSVTVSNTTSYSWQVSPSAGVLISNISSNITIITFPPINQAYTVKFIALNGSLVTTKQLAVTAYEMPDVTFSGAQWFCSGSSTNLSASATFKGASSTLIQQWMPSTGLNTPIGPYVNASPLSPLTYTLLTLNGVCVREDTISVYLDACVGIRNYQPSDAYDLRIYPNPSSGIFSITSDKRQQVFITNELGQTIRLAETIPEIETKVSDLPPGIYFVVTAESRKKIIVTSGK